MDGLCSARPKITLTWSIIFWPTFVFQRSRINRFSNYNVWYRIKEWMPKTEILVDSFAKSKQKNSMNCNRKFDLFHSMNCFSIFLFCIILSKLFKMFITLRKVCMDRICVCQKRKPGTWIWKLNVIEGHMMIRKSFVNIVELWLWYLEYFHMFLINFY